MRILLRMRHGLGDNAQFSIVTRHIQHYFPHWKVHLEVGSGKQSYFKGQVKRIYHRKEEYDYRNYHEILDVIWPVPEYCSSEVPSTKPTRFLEKVLNVKPIEEMYRGYRIKITRHEHRLADEYVNTLPGQFVLVHYLAKTLKDNKSLSHNDARFICSCISAMGYTPVLLDWKNESPLPDNRRIFNPGADNPIWEGVKNSSAGTLAALISRAKLYVGIDSGPLHVAGSTDTPSIGVWHGHHPINFFDLCDNVTHLVADGVKIKGKKTDRAVRYFEANYNYLYYSKLKFALADAITERLEKRKR